MQIQQLNRTDAERVVIVYKNVDGSGSITTGLGVALVQAGASIDGISAVKMAAGVQKGFAGVSAQDVPINGYGLATAWGYAASVLISHEGSSITVTRGDTLKPSAVAGSFASSLTDQAISTLLYRFVYAGSTNTVSAAAYVTGVVRAL
jgi:hypothetical protein